MGRRFSRVGVGVFFLAEAVLFPRPAVSAWPSDPSVNLPVCTAPRSQMSSVLVSDGEGGAIVAWRDERDAVGSRGADVYAQRVLASGVVDPSWPPNGRPLCTDCSPAGLVIVSDGAGGAIVAWADGRTRIEPRPGVDYDIYAQHVLSTGAVDPAWPVNGLAVCTAVAYQSDPQITTDGAGGAIVTWQDWRNSSSGSGGGPEENRDVYVQHVLGAGSVDPMWPVDGRALCVAGGLQTPKAIVSDGSGGAIVVWEDYRSMTDYDVYAQRVLGTGEVDPLWPVDGVAVCALSGNQHSPQMIPDGATGVIIVWADYRSGTANVFSQHVLIDGTIDPTWPAQGRALCMASGLQVGPRVVEDGAQGAIVAWADRRTGTDFDVYAQHLLNSGQVDPSWPANGSALCTASGHQYPTGMVSDNSGGAIVMWGDLRSGVTDIYALRIASDGAVGATWPSNGTTVCIAAGHQHAQAIVADTFGGAIMCWDDQRDSAGDNWDVYAQRVLAGGQLGGDVLEVRDAGWRELEIHVQNPTIGGRFRVEFSLRDGSPARLELMDVAGRLLRAVDVGSLGPGRHTLDLANGVQLRPGIYFMRLTQGGSEVRGRVAVVK